jgi:hypothetical protein
VGAASLHRKLPRKSQWGREPVSLEEGISAGLEWAGWDEEWGADIPIERCRRFSFGCL